MRRMRKLWRNKMAETINYGMFIGLALAIVIAVSLVPTVVETINGTENLDEWDDDLIGGSGASAIYQLIVLIFVAGIAIWVIRKALD